MLENLLHHKLLSEGEQGQGVVTARHDQASDSSTHVPVRYDPSDHSKAVLDVVALEESKQAERAKDAAWDERLKQQEIAAADAQAAEADKGFSS